MRSVVPCLHRFLRPSIPLTMRIFTTLAFLFVFFAAFPQNLKSGGILKAEQAIMDIRHYTISLNVEPVKKTIDGFTEIDLVLTEPTQVLLFDLVGLLSVKKVRVNSRDYPFTHEDDLIRITTNSPIPAGRARILIEYGGTPGEAENAPWSGGFTWAKDSTGNHFISITCQNEGAKIYFPCKDHPSDEPNEGATLIITVPRGLYVAGPGLLKNVSTKGNTSTFQWETEYTISNYCIVFNIGKYKLVERPYTTVDGNKVPMQFYVLEEHAHRAEHHLDLFERSARVLEKYFGEYPWVSEKMAICETPHLGMEHQTLNAYGNKFRYQLVGGKDFDWLLHHEFGHEWWANKVTNVDWAHMWIQEGICSFGDALYTRELEGEESYLKRMRRTGRATQNKFPIVRGDSLDTDIVYHGDIYGKGAFFMHTLRFVIGDSIFFPTLKKLATAPEYTYDNFVDTEDVQQLFSGASAKDLKPLFDLYLRTTDKLEVLVQQTDEENYRVKFRNYDEILPIQIRTSGGIQKVNVSGKEISLESSSLPVVDPSGYYLKRVIYE